MRNTERSSNVLLGHWALHAKATALITVQPDTAGPINPDPAAAALQQLLHVAALTSLIDPPCIEQL